MGERKFAQMTESDKMFLLTSKFPPQVVVSPYARDKILKKKMYKTRLQRELFETCSK